MYAEEFRLGDYIKKRRVERKISQEELSGGICAVSSLSRIENDQQDPSRPLMLRLLERLGLPRSRFIALWDQENLAVASLMREIRHDLVRYCHTVPEDRPACREGLLKKLADLEAVVEEEDHGGQQLLLAVRTLLGGSDGPYSVKERMAGLLEAIRMTSSQFDPDYFQRGHYSLDEKLLIGQLADAYWEAGRRRAADDMFGQLLWNMRKFDKELSGYGKLFPLVSRDYAIRLMSDRRYKDAADTAEQGRAVCLEYSDYQFLPSLLEIQAECFYFMQETERSRELYPQVYYLYKAYGDNRSLGLVRQKMKAYLGIEMP